MSDANPIIETLSDGTEVHCFKLKPGTAMTVSNLKRWLDSLPPEFDDAEIQGAQNYGPGIAKRVVAYRWKQSGECGVVVNPLGVHLREQWWDAVEVVSCFSSRWDQPDDEDEEGAP